MRMNLKRGQKSAGARYHGNQHGRTEHMRAWTESGGGQGEK